MGVGKPQWVHGISPEVKSYVILQLNSYKHCGALAHGESEIDFIFSWILFNLYPQ